MKISDFKNKYNGRMGFVLGAAPSLLHLDVSLIREHICITVNSGIVKYPDCDFFISDDYDISRWSYYRDIVKKSSCIKFLYKNKFQDKCNDLKDFVLFCHKSWFSPEDKSYNFDGLKLKKDGILVGARTSCASAVNILFLMGCDPIVLLGNDCQLSKDKHHYRYFFQYFPKNKQPFKIKGSAFTDQTQNRGFNKDSFAEYWNYFAEVNKNNKVNIIDASDSCLNCFPKMSIKEVLDKYGDK